MLQHPLDDRLQEQAIGFGIEGDVEVGFAQLEYLRGGAKG